MNHNSASHAAMSRPRSIFTVMLVACAVHSAIAGAQELEEVVVTANKVDAVSVQDANDSIQAFSEDMLEHMGVTEFADLSRAVPGLDVIDLGPSQKQYIIRGVSGPGESTVGVYVDNIPMVGSGADALLAGGNQSDLGVYDVSRVEVLRGPQGTLYGASSVSGVVRYITNKPKADAFAAGLQLDGATVSDGSPNYSVKGMVNMPLIDNALAIRATGYYTDSGGFVDNAVLGKPASCYARNIPNPNQPTRLMPELAMLTTPGCLDGSIAKGYKDINSYTTLGGRLQGLWDITERDSLLLQYHYQKVDMDGRTAVNPFTSTYVIGPPSVNGGNNFFTAAVGRNQTNVRSMEPHKDQIDILALEYDHKLDWGTITIAASYLDRDVVDYRDSSSPSRLHRRFKLTPLGPWAGATLSRDDRVTSYQELGTEQYSVEARLAGKNEGMFNYLVGVYYQDLVTSVDSTVFQTDAISGRPIPNTLTLLERVGSVDQKSKAAFGELYFHPTEKVELMAGARWFKQQRDQYSNLIVPFVRSVPIGGAPGIQPSDPQSFDDITYKAQITWKPTEQVQLYAQYAEGFRSGGVNARITPNIPPSFEPDTATSTELGIKTQWMDRRLFANFYIYEIVWDNLQLGAAFTGQFNGMVNCTEQNDPAKSNGWEAEVTFAMTDRVTVGANFTDMNARWTVDPNSCLPAALVATLSDPLGGAKGQNLVGVPNNSGSAFVDVGFDWNANVEGFFRADLAYQGEVPINQMRVDRNLPNPSYWLGNLRLGAKLEKYELAVYVKNVTNEEANLSLFNTFQQENRVTPAQPRTIGLTLSASF